VKPIIILSMLGMLACWAEGADYYVANQGDDGNPGDSPAAAWRTIAKANASVAPGDTVHILGGTYSEAIAPEASGTEEKRITFKAHRKEKVLLTGVPLGIVMKDRAYVTVDGIACDQTEEYVRLENSHHVWITNSTFDHSSATDGWPNGVCITQNSHHNRISNCWIARVGYIQQSGRRGYRGGVMVIARGSDHNLIENSTLFYGGHHVVEIMTSHNVIRNNYFHNEKWMRCNGEECGYRNIIIEGTDAQRNVVEGNTFAFSGRLPSSRSTSGSSAFSLRTPRNIVRRNIFSNNAKSGLYFGISEDMRHNHVYNNVFFHNGYNDAEGSRDASGLFLLGRQITDLIVVNNIFWQNKDGRAVSFRSRCDPAKQFFSHNWQEAGDPHFMNDEAPADPFKPELLDFRLRATSPCIDAGDFLTHTTADGQGTAIQVADAGFFTDGYGVVEGDLIQLEGDTRRLRVLQVDCDGNVIQIDAPVAWRAGQGVSQPFSGARPDIGAYEH